MPQSAIYAAAKWHAEVMLFRTAVHELLWPATERAAQRRSAQHAGVDDVGALAKAWGRGVQARLQGNW